MIKINKINNGYEYEYKNKKYSLTIENNWCYGTETEYQYVLFKELDNTKSDIYNHIWSSGYEYENNIPKDIMVTFDKDHNYIIEKYFIGK